MRSNGIKGKGLWSASIIAAKKRAVTNSVDNKFLTHDQLSFELKVKKPCLINLTQIEVIKTKEY
jgi:hypothetical protein